MTHSHHEFIAYSPDDSHFRRLYVSLNLNCSCSGRSLSIVPEFMQYEIAIRASCGQIQNITFKPSTVFPLQT